ncbi:Uncharacterised protein [Chryseobacterium taihuense]|uniref:Uncharacterized protein n=1 Tax=Chryseobacterium taihuense TaxID=1141221 RepID=A0A4U8W8G8_9FLAO|nr:Uncharacterised protein [Chryseobacterium taihuense]
MIKDCILILSILFVNFCFCQQLSVKILEDAAENELILLDRLMIDHHQYIREYDPEETKYKVYSNNSEDAGKLVVLTVIAVKDKTCKNAVSAVSGKNTDMAGFRKQLSDSQYVFQGEKTLTGKIKLLHYSKNNKGISFTEEITQSGGYQILFTCR